MAPPHFLTRRIVRSWFPARRLEAHKGNFGHVLILAGSRGMTGAAVLSGVGALRSGAGLVTVGVPGTEQRVIARKLRPEAMSLGLAATRRGALAASAWRQIALFIHHRRITVLAVGPGLSVNPGTRSLIKKILSQTSLPLVLDADGLNNVAGRPPWLTRRAGWPLIVTPHPGEMGRLAGASSSRIQSDRVGQAMSFARRHRVICVLKGHRTVVTNGDTCYVNTTGNPGMATGGSGDVLTGLLAGILAQKVRALRADASLVEKCRVCLQASAASVFLHGLAGDLAAKSKTQMGLLAMDIAEAIPQAIQKILG